MDPLDAILNEMKNTYALDPRVIDDEKKKDEKQDDEPDEPHNHPFDLIYNPKYFQPVSEVTAKKRQLLCCGFLRRNFQFKYNPKDISSIVEIYTFMSTSFKPNKNKHSTDINDSIIKDTVTSSCLHDGMILIKPEIHKLRTNIINIKFLSNSCNAKNSADDDDIRRTEKDYSYSIECGVIGIPKHFTKCNPNKFEMLFYDLEYNDCNFSNLNKINDYFKDFQRIYISMFDGYVTYPDLKFLNHCYIGLNDNNYHCMIHSAVDPKSNEYYQFKIGTKIQICFDKTDDGQSYKTMYFKNDKGQMLNTLSFEALQHNVISQNGKFLLDCQNYWYYVAFTTQRCTCKDTDGAIFQISL